MKHSVLLLAFLLPSAAALAETPEDELAKRSGLPASEVAELLSNCDANQASMNLCAWRDQIAAEQELQRAVDQKGTVSPECKAALERKIAAWKMRRDVSCQRTVEKTWGGGAVFPAAVALCATTETKRMTTTVATTKCR
jgi:Lysozyme inhibitor LprI